MNLLELIGLFYLAKTTPKFIVALVSLFCKGAGLGLKERWLAGWRLLWRNDR